MHIAVFEPNPKGHRFAYVRRLLPALAGLGQRVSLVTSEEGASSPEFQEHLASVAHLCEVEASMRLARSTSVAAILRSNAGNLQRVVLEAGVDHVLVLSADGAVQVAGLQRLMGRFRVPHDVEIEGLLMRGAFAYGGRGLATAVRNRAWLRLTGAAPFSILHHLDPIVVREFQRQAPVLAHRVRLMPDPADPPPSATRAEARRSLGLPEDGRYIGCVGVMDIRKGIDLLIEAFTDARVAPTDRLLLAGIQDESVRSLLRGPAGRIVREGRIIEVDRFLSNDDLAMYIAALDVVVAPYALTRGHFGSSSIAIAAAAQERPVLGDRDGWIGETVRRFKLGSVCDVTDRADFARAIASSLEGAAYYRQGEGGRRLVAYQQTENFAACFTRRLRERLALPAETGLPTWEWVLEAAVA